MLTRINYHKALAGDLPECDVYLVTMRSPYKGLAPGWRHVPALAPSRELFNKYLAWAKAGLWPQNADIYRDAYLKGLKFEDIRPEDSSKIVRPNSPARALSIVRELSNKGMNVGLICACPVEKEGMLYIYCHNQILVELLDRS